MSVGDRLPPGVGRRADRHDRSVRRVSALIVIAMLAACSGGSTTARPSGSTTGSQLSASYIFDVNALCLELKGQVQKIRAEVPPHYPVQDFLHGAALIRPLTAAFDQKVAALHPRPEDATAARAFAAYVQEVSGTRELLVQAAQTSQAAYDAEYDRQNLMYDTDPVLAKIDALGFAGACHYR
jgi:CO/xanthine dehydrogenase FAD-binding subunit